MNGLLWPMFWSFAGLLTLVLAWMQYDLWTINRNKRHAADEAAQADARRRRDFDRHVEEVLRIVRDRCHVGPDCVECQLSADSARRHPAGGAL